MESFDSNQHGVKEKSVYLLHLDTPRIILIASVIIGVIAASFLFGMNFINKGNKGLTAGDPLLAENKTSMMGDGAIPPAPDGAEITDNMTDKAAGSEKDPAKIDTGAGHEKDILTADNIKEIIHPAHEEKGSPEIIEKAADTKKKIANRPASDEKKSPAKKKKKKVSKKTKDAVEVVDSDKKGVEKIKSGGFAIQIGAFDKKSKADSEVKNLNDLKYDSYIDKTSVSGKTYFRVRVGPMKSGSAAVNLMNELQDNPRYQNCYIIRE